MPHLRPQSLHELFSVALLTSRYWMERGKVEEGMGVKGGFWVLIEEEGEVGDRGKGFWELDKGV